MYLEYNQIFDCWVKWREWLKLSDDVFYIGDAREKRKKAHQNKNIYQRVVKNLLLFNLKKMAKVIQKQGKYICTQCGHTETSEDKFCMDCPWCWCVIENTSTEK